MHLDHLKILKDSDLSQKEISNKLGIHIRTLQNYLSGRKMPDYVKKLIEYELTRKTVNEPAASCSTSEHDIQELKYKIQAKDDLTVELKKNVNSLQKIVELLEGQNELLKFQLSVAKRNDT